jgi:hypothetical protein
MKLTPKSARYCTNARVIQLHCREMEVFGGMQRSGIALETGMHSPWMSRLLS